MCLAFNQALECVNYCTFSFLILYEKILSYREHLNSFFFQVYNRSVCKLATTSLNVKKEEEEEEILIFDASRLWLAS